MNPIEAIAEVGLQQTRFTRADLLAAFRRRAAVCHPDRGGDADSFQRLTAAYKILELVVVDDSAGNITVEGVPLADLGHGFPLTKNATKCVACNGAGYTTREIAVGATITCPKCHGYGIMSFVCRRCGGKGCRWCRDTGRFFPRPSEADIRRGFTHLKNGDVVEVRRAANLRDIQGKICFDCDGSGRIQWDRGWFDNSKRSVGRELADILVANGKAKTMDDAKEMLGFACRDSRVDYYKCVTCDGVGETELWNPVIPRGLLGTKG